MHRDQYSSSKPHPRKHRSHIASHRPLYTPLAPLPQVLEPYEFRYRLRSSCHGPTFSSIPILAWRRTTVNCTQHERHHHLDRNRRTKSSLRTCLTVITTADHPTPPHELLLELHLAVGERHSPPAVSGADHGDLTALHCRDLPHEPAHVVLEVEGVRRAFSGQQGVVVRIERGRRREAAPPPRNLFTLRVVVGTGVKIGYPSIQLEVLEGRAQE